MKYWHFAWNTLSETKIQIYTPKWDDEHPRLFHMEVPPPPPRVQNLPLSQYNINIHWHSTVQRLRSKTNSIPNILNELCKSFFSPFQKAARKKMCCILVVLIVVAAALSLIIYFSLRKNWNSLEFKLFCQENGTYYTPETFNYHWA